MPLLQNRSGHGNRLAALVSSADISGKVTEGGHPCGWEIPRARDAHHGVGRVATKLKALVGFEYFVALDFSQGLRHWLCFSRVCNKAELTVDKVDQDVLHRSNVSAENPL